MTPASSTSSSSSAQDSISKAEAMFYYSGLYSSPRLVYRTGTTPWTKPTGPEAQRELKELRPVFGHKLNIVWKDLGPKVCDFLDSNGGLVDDHRRRSPLSRSERERPSLPSYFGLTFSRSSTSPTSKSSTGSPSTPGRPVQTSSNPFPTSTQPVDVRGPLTPVLGLFIAAQATPHAEGTGGLYTAEGGDSKKVLLVTARHVLFPPNEGLNVDYARTNTSAPRRNVLLLGTKAFDNLVKSIKIRIRRHGIMVELYNRQIKKLQAREADEDDVGEATRKLKKTQRLLDEANEAIEALEKFHDKVKKKWSQPSQRVLGHIVCSPPITSGAGTEGFTEDYAVVELDSSKIDKAFKGNVIDLGTKIPFDEFTLKMYPCTNATTAFKYPDDRLLGLRDLISEELMHNPDMLDHDGESCLLVIKNGNTTGVTIGRATGIFSYVREYFNNGTHQTSMEWAILPYDNKSGVFSAPGDSGSIIADPHGRIGGLLTSGAGKMESSDVTYAMPFFWLFLCIKNNGFPNAHLYLVLA